jgi:hypothetical protein
MLRPRPAWQGRRGLVVVAALVVLLGAVAITAGMTRPAAGAPQGVTVPPQALIAWGLSAALAAGLLISVMGPFWTGREKWVVLMLALLLLLGFAILAERSHPQQQAVAQQPQPVTSPLPQQQPTAIPSAGQNIPPSARRPPAAVRTTPALAPWTVAVIGAAALLLAVLVLRGSGGRGGTARRASAAEALSDAVDASMVDVAAEPDPRRAIVAAWISMGDALARHGLGRRPDEAPVEYMRRALRAVRVSAGSAQRLTALFQRARYSDHPATTAMRDEALAALQSVRDDLDRP